MQSVYFIYQDKEIKYRGKNEEKKTRRNSIIDDFNNDLCPTSELLKEQMDGGEPAEDAWGAKKL